ncbi:hypothetical protein NKR19_g4480 [Coniochaeta hoffmannii]|uniref:Uncharacterized protein n=1 Tax=Coniochaeta hoffmannii TaxID=91930 RepID=A0AA38RP24_9PEZI|nr:hypothetical protein NKR19_g4480 [Coniochaeta hoffmannii]
MLQLSGQYDISTVAAGYYLHIHLNTGFWPEQEALLPALRPQLFESRFISPRRIDRNSRTLIAASGRAASLVLPVPPFPCAVTANSRFGIPKAPPSRSAASASERNQYRLTASCLSSFILIAFRSFSSLRHPQPAFTSAAGRSLNSVDWTGYGIPVRGRRAQQELFLNGLSRLPGATETV